MAASGTKSWQEIQKKVDSTGLKWTASDTPHLQMPDDEFRTRFGYGGKTHPSVLLRTEQDAHHRYHEWRSQQTAPAIPTHLDWRDIAGRSFISPVKTQGGCNSCVAFGTGAALSARMRITLKVAVNDPNSDVLEDVSEEQLLSCGGGPEVCEEGWWVDEALAFCEDPGVVPASSVPYDPPHLRCDLYPGWRAQVTRIGGFEKLSTMEDMRQRLYSSGPLIAKMALHADFKAYRGGVYHPTDSPIIDQHVLCVIGYDDAKSAWLCKNSWGTYWGEDGYCWIAYGKSGLGSGMWSITSFEKLYTRREHPLRRSA